MVAPSAHARATRQVSLGEENEKQGGYSSEEITAAGRRRRLAKDLGRLVRMDVCGARVRRPSRAGSAPQRAKETRRGKNPERAVPTQAPCLRIQYTQELYLRAQHGRETIGANLSFMSFP